MIWASFFPCRRDRERMSRKREYKTASSYTMLTFAADSKDTLAASHLALLDDTQDTKLQANKKLKNTISYGKKNIHRIILFSDRGRNPASSVAPQLFAGCVCCRCHTADIHTAIGVACQMTMPRELCFFALFFSLSPSSELICLSLSSLSLVGRFG